MSKQGAIPRYVIITGATGGIGQALVAEFQDNGYAVIATDRVEKPENLVCDHYLKIDLANTVTDVHYANQVFAEIRDILPSGGLHVLINNAAIQILNSVDLLTREDWQQTLNVNLLAPFFWVQALLPELEQTEEGCVVNISSIHARLTKREFVAYATSKAALSGMTKALAVDLGARVRINAIEPAAIETEMLKAGFIGKPELYRQLKNCHPQQRIGQPEEVARLVLSIVDGSMGFMHGAVVGLDGGISNRLFDPD